MNAKSLAVVERELQFKKIKLKSNVIKEEIGIGYLKRNLKIKLINGLSFL